MARRSPPLPSRPPGFTWRGSQLCCEQAPLARLAARFGTPLYVYSARAIEKRYRRFARAFRALPHTVCYSVKANSNLSLLRLLAGLGAGFDVVSGGELARVLVAAPRAAGKVVFSGVGKTAEELDAALQAGILLFNVESESELELLAARAARLRLHARVGLRVNPDVPARTHPYISTGLREHKFGVPMSEAARLFRRGAGQRYLHMCALSTHIGSQIGSAKPFAAAVARLAALLQDLRARGHEISYLDCGGGLGVAYEGDTAAHFERRLAAYAPAVLRPLRGLGVHLLLEPGRAIVAHAGALVTEVLHVKRNRRKRFVVVDAAMNDLIRPALYQAHHEVVPVAARGTGRSGRFDVVGPVCETGDFLARGRRLQEPSPGDLLALLDTGAYGMSLASNYNTRARAAEVLVRGARARVIRRRESLLDLLRSEL
jgi:diaminopimelate decarboxylase